MDEGLQFDVARATQQFCQEHPQYAKEFKQYPSKGHTLEALGRILVFGDAEVRETLCRTCRPLLPELLSRASQAEERQARLCLALGDLLPRYPEVAHFVELYLEQQRLPLEEECPPRKKARGESHRRSLLRCGLQLIRHVPHVVARWDWGPLVRSLGCGGPECRWFACQCYALVLGMSEAQRRHLVQRFLVPQEISRLDLRLALEVTLDGPRVTGSSTKSNTILSSSDLSCRMSCVSGVLLPAGSGDATTDLGAASFNFIPVPSGRRALHLLAEWVAQGSQSGGALLRGPVGCGKTWLVEHLAAKTGHKLLAVQLGDQTDSHTLLGSYVCGQLPGKFLWNDGPLASALKEGYWLLLEDLDLAPGDISGLLVPVLRGRAPAGLPRAPGFRIFATLRWPPTGPAGTSPQQHHKELPTERLWRTVVLEHPSRDELQQIVVGRWPVLTPLVDRLLDLFTFLRSECPSLRRALSLRDLCRLCARISLDFSLESRKAGLAAFQDALDCLCQSVRDPEDRLVLAAAVGARFNLSKAEAQFYCIGHKPSVGETVTSITIGRATLPRIPWAGDTKLPRGQGPVFAHTRQSLALLERVAVAVTCNEPVLLVGETGIGKTATVQYLAHLTGKELSVVNLSQASDSVDLVGGFKPLEMRLVLGPIREDFERLFTATFSQAHNAKFLGHITGCFLQRRWNDLFRLMAHAQQSALRRLTSQTRKMLAEKGGKLEDSEDLRERWMRLGRQLRQLQAQQAEDNCLAFAFVQGTLVRALESGSWILLDEVNLAEAETLECLNALLEGGSLVLFEKGEQRPVRRHKDFRLFACMNPATDVGKRDLPVGVRNRFTELYLEEPLEPSDLELVVRSYMSGLSSPKQAVGLYLELRKLAETTLCDGTGRRPHYSLRTLCRALRYAATDPCQSLLRSLYEGFCLSFLTALNRESHPTVESLIRERLLKTRAPMGPPPHPPASRPNSVLLEGHWVGLGPLEPRELPGYVLTATVRRNLRDLARAAACGRHPVLLQGETSAGKTSLVQWLAARTGHVCVRLNNHEHTDLQEYVGSYGTDPESGRLVFKEGVLVEAMRKGHWIILDELNLACSEILEALNRVLDDNRELFVAETQQTVKAHPDFVLFATQNPPGHYGGRKVLSRAFRNRFLELHFEELPPAELESILQERCALPASYSKKMVAVLLELQVRRRESGVFAGKRSYMTLRDLFRWAERYRLTTVPNVTFYDWDQHLADEGYMLLAGRVRKPQEAEVIAEVLERRLKRKVDPGRLFGAESPYAGTPMLSGAALPPQFGHLVWTTNARRLAVLLGRALHFEEPVLLVGETGCGKTTLCQLWATMQGLALHCVNCHMHSEAADLLGGLRPARGEGDSLFEWAEGPLVSAVRTGRAFLLDEISLAEDAVLERLNSLLEPQRTLLLAEQNESLVAHPDFRFMATMNPAGDFGKKELSPALRNRFTEIWCPSDASPEDVSAIVEHNVHAGLKGSSWGSRIADFVTWLGRDPSGSKCIASIRDILAWVEFVNRGTRPRVGEEPALSPEAAYVHGACLVFLDGAGKELREQALGFLVQQLGDPSEDALQALDTNADVGVIWDDRGLAVGPFLLPPGRGARRSPENGYTLLKARTPRHNALRLARAMQLGRPLLLEGPPGVGKTSLVVTMAAALGYPVTRINLSEHTDITDLFGADLPVEGSPGGRFAWRDGPLLRALKEGHWILLDELNLASQSVLEGLNACLDHRGEIFVPELNRTFRVKPGQTRILGCQNPHAQGGGRKGLPRSFRNRFTQVHLAPLMPGDLLGILSATHPDLPEDLLRSMVEFNQKLVTEVCERGEWGHGGGPWQFNLRDLSRWAQLTATTLRLDPAPHVELLYAGRMRSRDDASRVLETFHQVFGRKVERRAPQVVLTEKNVHVGLALLPRSGSRCPSVGPREDLRLLHRQLVLLEHVATCLERGMVPLLVGPSGNGKGSAVRLLAHLSGRPLAQLHVTTDMDTADLLGGFQQVDLNLRLSEVLELAVLEIRGQLLAGVAAGSESLLSARHQLEEARLSKEVDVPDFLDKVDRLKKILQSLPQHGRGWQAKIVQQLEELREAAVRGGALCGGGQFEWRDGVLVRSLLEGSWLLVENVNFCSAAVLDRLNGLLEPGGVLAMTEQGVVGEELRVVTPAPEFRLVLAMDPKNGEISQAMRNRTVEIFVPSEEGGEPLDPWDGYALMASAGLVYPELTQKILRAHSTVCHALAGGPKKPPSLWELRTAVSLARQRASRGVPVADALRESLEDVYFPDLSSSDAERAKLSLDEALDCAETCEAPGELRLLVSAVASPPPSTRTFHSGLARVQEDSLALCAVLMTGRHGVLLPVGLPSTLADAPELVSTASRLFLERASAGDLETRLGWLDHLGSQFPEHDASLPVFAKRLSAVLAAAFRHRARHLGHLLDLEELPVDLFQYPEIRSRLLARSSREGSPTEALLEEAILEQTLRVHLGLRHAELTAVREKEPPREGCLLWVSYQKHESHPALAHLAPILEALEAALVSWLESAHVGSGAAYSKARAALWCLHSWAQACAALPERSPWSGSLAVHWTWLRKTVLKCLHPDGRLPQDLAVMVNRLEADLSAELTRCTRGRMGRRLGLPAPLRHRDCLAAYEAACGLTQRCLALMRGHPAVAEALTEEIPGWLAKLGSCLRAALDGRLPSAMLEPLKEEVEGQETKGVEEENPLARTPQDRLIPKYHLEPVCALAFSIVEAEAVGAVLGGKHWEVPGNHTDYPILHPLHWAALHPPEGPSVDKDRLQKGEWSVLLCEHLCHERSLLQAAEEAIAWKPSCYGPLPPEASAALGLQGHVVYLNPTMSSLCCALAVPVPAEQTTAAPATLGSFPHKCREADQLKALLWHHGGHVFDSARFWANQADVVRAWFCELARSIPGFPEHLDPLEHQWEHWGSTLRLPTESLREILREAAACVASLGEKRGTEDTSSRQFAAGLSWSWVGLCTLTLLTPWDPLDPAHKVQLKLEHTEQQLRHLETELSLRSWAWEARTGHPWDPEAHPALAEEARERERLRERERYLRSKAACRPPVSQYPDLSRQLRHYTATLGSVDRVLGLVTDLKAAWEGGGPPSGDVGPWLTAQTEFADRLRLAFPAYRDIVYPFLCGLNQLIHGIRILCRLVAAKQKLATIPGSTQLVGEAFAFPQGGLPTATRARGPDVAALLAASPRSVSRLVRSALLQLLDGCLVDRSRDYEWFCALQPLLAHVAGVWREHQEEQRQKEEAERSLFEYRHTAPEEEDPRKFFPSYAEDFDDLVEQNLLDDPVRRPAPSCEEEKGPVRDDLSEQDLADVWKWHTRMVSHLARSTPLVRPARDGGRGTAGGRGHLAWFLLRYRVLQDMVQEYGHLLDSSLDGQLLGSHLVAASSLQWASQQVPSEGHYNFYEDINVAETSYCVPVLNGLASRACSLLREFPEHPGLCQILKIIYRILSFPISCSAMKVLTGLELVLAAAQDWEANAHRGVSLRAELDELTALIIRLRKLELRSWSGCLDSVVQRRHRSNARWWCFLHDVVSPMLQCPAENRADAKAACKKLLEELVQLLEQSHLGDFESRLQLVATFLSHVLSAPTSRDTRLLGSVLFNVYHFYRQYLPATRAKLEADRKPIEKELKGFVKIVRWKDASFWALKQTAEKCHRTLHRHMKSFERVLEQRATDAFTLPQNEEGEVDSAWEPSLQPRDPEGEARSREHPGRRLQTVRRLLREVLPHEPHRDLVSAVDQVAREVASTVKQFAQEDSIEEPDKEKRKKRARLAHQCKRKALADLFKALAAMGLSYRKGLVAHKDVGPRTMLEAPSVDVEGALLQIGSAQPLLSEGCHKYYYRSVARLAAFERASAAPSKELELGTLERCRGFALHLAALVLDQRKRLCGSLRAVVRLRNVVSDLTRMGDGNLPSQQYLREWTGRINEALVESTLHLEQFELLVRSCPPPSQDLPSWLPREGTELERASYGDPAWSRISEQLTQQLDALGALSERLEPLHVQGLRGSVELDTLQDIMEQLGQVTAQVEEMRVACGPTLGRSLESLVTSLGNLYCEWDPASAVPERTEEKEASPAEEAQRALVARLLLATQELHAALKETQQASDEARESALEAEGIQEGLLRGSLLHEGLEKALHCLDLKQVSRRARQLIGHLAATSRRIDTMVTALLEEYLVGAAQPLLCLQLAAHRASLKLLYVLLSVFTTLATKGFCLPEEFKEELMQEGATQFQDIEEGGLGEGEGTRDVSERLESEDQLEGLQGEKTEKQEAKKEEEHGVEMSEDFEGQTQAPEEGEEDEDEEDEDEEEEEPKDQMGQVEDSAAEQLDKQLWESEGEEEEEEEGEMDGGGQDQKQEEQLRAKEGLKHKQKDSSRKEQDEPAEEDEAEPFKEEAGDQDEYPGEREDPYKTQQEQGPEPMELPEDLELQDEDEAMEDQECSSGEGEGSDEEKGGEDEEELPREVEDTNAGEESKKGEESKGVEETEKGDEEQREGEEAHEGDNSQPEKPQEGAAEVSPKEIGTGKDAERAPCGGAAPCGEENRSEGQGAGGATDEPVGQASSDGRGQLSGQNKRADARDAGQPQKSRNLLRASEDRSLAKEVEGPARRRNVVEGDAGERDSAEQFRHVRQDEDAHDELAVGAATEEQAAQHSTGDEDPDMAREDWHRDQQKIKHQDPVQVKGSTASSKDNKDAEQEEPMEVEGEVVLTCLVQRSTESSFHARPELLRQQQLTGAARPPSASQPNVSQIPSGTGEARRAWEAAERTVAPLVQELCEQLRLVLEPTKASKLRGDFRTGKRLNMRKVIAYIASQFRKDKIWLRRTRPSRRYYHVVLAVDDSRSMGATGCGPLALQSLALLARSLQLLEAGDLALLSFGEQVHLLHPLGQPWTTEAGAGAAEALSFEQERTRVGPMLRAARDLLEEGPPGARLLLIVSDGRGLRNEGDEGAAVREALSRGIFMVFLVLDNPAFQDSILDIRMPVFRPSGEVEILSYMEQFPFPFYVILRDVGGMPAVLGEALRQWLELVAGD